MEAFLGTAKSSGQGNEVGSLHCDVHLSVPCDKQVSTAGQFPPATSTLEDV